MTIGEFRDVAGRALGVDLSEGSSHGALLADRRRNLYLLAGAGTGKTTALAILALKAIFVDGHPAESIVATTFTRKAAAELRSRILRGLMAIADASGRQIDERQLDVTAMRIGTIDDLCNEALRELQLGSLVDGIVRNGRMRSAVFAATNGFRRTALQRDELLTAMQTMFRSTRQVDALRGQGLTLHDRLGHDRIDVSAWRASAPDVAGPLLRLVDEYRENLGDNEQMDFVDLEQRFLAELEGGGLAAWLDSVRVLLVDEYQDTNLLQETIYQRVAECAEASGGWFAVVGDDDQSLFRFRGATVELFVDAPGRFDGELEIVPLNVNRRSSRPIIEFANRFVALDDEYSPARAEGKVPLAPASDRSRWTATDRIPVLGLFRPDAATLAAEIASHTHELLGDGWDLPGATVSVSQPGDIALLAPTTAAVKEGNNGIQTMLCGHVGGELERRGVRWFNPRGTRLADVPPVQRLLGLMLMCLDPDESRAPNFVPFQAADHFARWRAVGSAHLGANPSPQVPHGLADFVEAWQRRETQGGGRWPREFPVMELLHELSVWIPELRSSPGFVYMEGLTRALEQVGTLLGPWATLVTRDRWDTSVERIYKEFLIPVAMDEVELDEEVLEVLPADAVNALTIHQAKGLEFPVCFVDVGSRFRTSHWTQAFARFPNGDRLLDPYSLEEALRPFSDGLEAPARGRQDRAFDDLVRSFYVAFTRAQHVLVLCGLGDEDDGPRAIENVATGWSRDGENRWEELGVTLL